MRDTAGNTLPLIAAALIPLLALVGGGIDMGRSYLAQTRLQEACDSGTLAARKKLGTTIALTGTPPADVKTVGDKFFNQNFRTGAYGTKNRSFTMTLEADYAISGAAHIDVPTTIMGVFGKKVVAIDVTCQAKLNFSNTDIMFVLDTTGSMNDTNPGDTDNKITSLKQVVRNFYTQMEGSKSPGTRMRYGFVPYSTNVNVGGLLKSDWMADSGVYSGREAHDTGTTTAVPQYQQNWTYESGSLVYGTAYSTAACPTSVPSWTLVAIWTDSSGSTNYRYVVNGTGYNCTTSAEGLITATPYTYTNYTYVYTEKLLGTKIEKNFDWTYKDFTIDVSTFKDSNGSKPPKGGKIKLDMGGYPEKVDKLDAWYSGCIEERGTYVITDYANVDLTRAKDLDIDLVPTAGNPDTQWKFMLPDVSWMRGINWWNWSSWPWSVAPVNYDGDYIHAAWNGYAACPAQAAKLSEMSATAVSNYVDSLVPAGSTYHDIGMIWGGRLLSPTGLFAAENADVGGSATHRHLIFLTDGYTAPMEGSYGTYGIEPLNGRRWNSSSPYTLTQTVENRFTVACNEVKKKNITVWVISFGLDLNPVLTNCAGADHSFTAKDAATLNSVFTKIAEAMGDLRISK
ncbi:MAG: Tad domain-containing protein [Novosphingobium sp.]